MSNDKILGPKRIPTAEDKAAVEIRAAALYEPNNDPSNARFKFIYSLGSMPPGELIRDAAPGINRVPLTFQKRGDLIIELCKQSGTDPFVALGMAEHVYQQTEAMEAQWIGLEIISRTCL